MADTVAGFEPDLVVLAGFMKLVSEDFLARFDGRVVNTHPALSPSFPGMQGPAEALAYGVKVTGCTLFVVDGGRRHRARSWRRRPSRSRTTTPSRPCTSGSRSPSARMLVDAVGRMAREGFTIDGRRVRFGTMTRPYSGGTRLAQVGPPPGSDVGSIERLGALIDTMRSAPHV